MSPSPTRRHVVGVAVTDGAPAYELAVPCEVFGLDRSDLVDPWYELRLCAAQPGPLTTAPGLLLQSPYGLDDLAEADTVLIPGLTRSHQLDPPPGLVAAVRKAYEAGKRIVALCAGAYVPAAAGVRQWGYPRQ